MIHTPKRLVIHYILFIVSIVYKSIGNKLTIHILFLMAFPPSSEKIDNGYQTGYVQIFINKLIMCSM